MAQTHSLDLESSSSQYASIADASQTGLDLTGNFSIEAWIKIEQLPSTAGSPFAIVNKMTGQTGYRLALLNTDVIRVYYGNGTNATTIDSGTFVTSADVGKWIHVAVSVNVAARTGSCYKNGRSVTFNTLGGADTGVAATAQPFYVGRHETGVWYFDGLMKDVRVFNDIRTQTEVVSDARTQDVSDANLVGEWNFNGDYADSSGNNNTLTESGSPVFSVDIPWEAPVAIESSAYVLDLESGSSQYASIADASQTGLDISGDHTIEFWINPESLPSSGNVVGVVAKDDLASNRSYAVDLYNNAGTQTIRMFMSGNATGTNYTEVVFTYTLPVGAWTHVAIATTIANAASSRSRLYINGLDQGNGTGANGGSGVASIYNGTASFNIGSYSNPSLYFDGLIKHVRVFNDVRTQTEIVSDALATTVSNANLVGEWALNNSYADTSGNSNTLTGSGSPTFRKWANKLAGGLVSYYTMDETSGNRADSHGPNTLTDNNTVLSAAGKKSNAADFESANSESLSIADGSQSGMDVSGDFSIALWFNPESLPGSNTERDLVSKWATGQLSYKFATYNNAGTQTIGADVTSDGSTSSFKSVNHTLTTGTFQHLVLVYRASAGAFDFYVDGKSLGSTTGSATSVFNGTASFRVGASDFGDYSDGVIDEVSFHARALGYGDVLDLYNEGNAITYLPLLTVDTSDTVSVSESVTVSLGSFINVFDELVVSEQIGYYEEFIVIEENIVVEVSSPAFGVDVFDAISLAEATTTESFSFVAIGDDLAVAESTIQSGEAYLSVSDTLTAEDSVTLNTSPFAVEIDDLNKWGVVVF